MGGACKVRGRASEERLLKMGARVKKRERERLPPSLSSEFTLFTLPEGPLLQEQSGATLRSKKKKKNERKKYLCDVSGLFGRKKRREGLRLQKLEGYTHATVLLARLEGLVSSFYDQICTKKKKNHNHAS